MRQSVADLLRRLLQGSRLSPEEILWGMLICAFLFSTLHLITMFLTRWGDRRVTGKALLFSLMMHFAFAVGTVTVLPVPAAPEGGSSDEEHQVVIRSVQVETENESLSRNNVQAPIWDRVPAVSKTEMTLPDPKTPEPPPVPSPDRVKEPNKSTELKPPDLASLPEERPAFPKPQQQEPAKPAQPAQTPEIETPKTETSPKPQPPAPSMAPRDPSPASKVDANVDRQATKLPKKKSDSQPDPARELASIPSAGDPKANIARAKPDAAVPRQAPPAPSTAPPEESAAAATKPPKSAIKPLSRASVTPTVPEARMNASIERVRPKDSPSAAKSSRPPEGVGDYQPTDARPSPQVERTTAEPLVVRRSAGVPSTYRLRKLTNRKENARQFGGNDESEQAVELSLHWLAKVQHKDGYWDADAYGAGQVKIDELGVDREFAGRDADSGVTALAILAFLAAGYTHEEGRYADNVERALRWLISQQTTDGNFGSAAGHFAMMYCHGMSTYAVAEAYGMQSDPTSNTMLREPLVRGIRFILDNQNPNDGGWRYVKGQKSDMSMFGWQLMALKSAEIAGLNVPYDAKARMVRFLRDRSLGDKGGLAGYRENLPPTSAMTAEALFCKQMLGIKRDNAASREAAEYLLARLPQRKDVNEYYWYYGTLAMYQVGGDEWRTWNGGVRDLLISEQRKKGEFAGSWDPTGPWAKFGGRIYATALSTLCLEVYYRFLPLYQIGGADAGEQPVEKRN